MADALYVLESEQNGRYYVGISSDPERRLRHHNATSTGCTARYRPWRLVFTATFPPAEFHPVISTEGPALPGPSGEISLRTGGTGKNEWFCFPL